MGKRRTRNESLESLNPELADPLRRLQTELSRLKKPAGAGSQDVVVSRILEALRQVGEALAPLTRGEEDAPPVSKGPVLAFRRAPAEEGSGTSEVRGPRVLVVEPEPSLNDYIHSLLDREGFSVVSIPGIEAALERARLEAPDVVALDQFVLRHGEAADWLVRFKTDPALVRIPIVLLRSPEGSEDEEPPRPFGVAAIVTKPLEPDEFLKALRAATAVEDTPAEPEPFPPGATRVVRG